MRGMQYRVTVAKEKRAVALREARLPAVLARSAFQHVDEGQEEDNAKQFPGVQSVLCERQGCGNGAKQEDAAAEAAVEEMTRDSSPNDLFPNDTS